MAESIYDRPIDKLHQFPTGPERSDYFLELLKTLFTEEVKVGGGRITDA
jgi:hypothetical protein